MCDAHITPVLFLEPIHTHVVIRCGSIKTKNLFNK